MKRFISYVIVAIMLYAGTIEGKLMKRIISYVIVAIMLYVIIGYLSGCTPY